MSHEFRSELVSRLIRDLVAEILRSKHHDPAPSEKTLQNFEQLATSVIKKYRSISVNRYEVRRKLDALKEKFVVDNFKEYADHLEYLCGIILNHPVCLEHYEVDIQWSLLEFLCSLAYNPTGHLRRNPFEIALESPEEREDNTNAQLEEFYLKKALKEDFIPVQSFEENSDLSDWSDCEAENENDDAENFLIVPKKNEPISCSKTVLLAPHLPALEPPIKEKHYHLLEHHPDFEQRLKDSVQHGWWLDEESSQRVLSERKEANFATLLDDHMRRHILGFSPFGDPKVIDEFCLLRELLWIFYCPQKCKFFSVSSKKSQMQKNITIPSISVPTLSEFLKSNILRSVDQLHSLRSFLREVYDCQDQRLPRTFEHYAANLKSLVDPILEKFVELEERIIRQDDFEINTLISLQSTLRRILERLRAIYDVHKGVVLDYKKYPAHITSSFLLTALLQYSNMATSVTQSNLAISLFLASVKAFCNIVDCWWNEGRLDDWQSEFLVECTSEQKISFRLYSKDEKRSFFLPKHISKVICENRFMNIMMEHAMEAGYTLNLLYEISRIGDLRNQCGAVEEKLYNSIVSDVLRQVRTFRQMEQKNDIVDGLQEDREEAPSNVFQRDSTDDVFEHLTTNDEFLLLLFRKAGSEKQSQDTCDAVRSVNERDSNALELFEELEKYKQMLPLEELIVSSFERILRERVTFANKFVVDLYRKNVNILGHLQNIRKVLLLEASDIMHHFYSKLFKQIEDGNSWANAFVLTMQLDDTISSKHPEMSALFRLEINSAARVQTQKVTEAVDALTVNYSFSNELAKIITEEDMKTYNEVFRFLLKVKWGLASLENLKFSRVRERPIFARLEMGDFLMRRLEQLRVWMFYGVQCVHSHLTMHVLQAMGTQLDEKLLQSTNVREMEAVHKSYLATISEHCCLNANLSRIKFGIEQLLNLVFVLRTEWWSCLKYLDQYSPFSVHLSGDSDDLEAEDSARTVQIETIELTYIRCHQYLANILNNEVYINQNSFLSGLSAAFNTSLPC